MPEDNLLSTEVSFLNLLHHSVKALSGICGIEHETGGTHHAIQIRQMCPCTPNRLSNVILVLPVLCFSEEKVV